MITSIAVTCIVIGLAGQAILLCTTLREVVRDGL